MDWSSVDYLWIIVMFCYLFVVSFQWHPFTAEDPLVSKYVMMKKQINLHTRWGWEHVQHIFIFGWTIPSREQVWNVSKVGN